MSLAREIKEICQKYEIRPFRARGQNFLINEKILDRIVATADIKKDDVVLEIGAGLGTITKKLAEKAKKVIAVEIDKKLVEALREELKSYKNVEIIQEDIRKFPISDFSFDPELRTEGQFPIYKVVANLPFNITGRVLRLFLAELPQPQLMVLVLQREVVQRICARPGQMSQLAVMVQFFSQPKIVTKISKNNFWPVPRVDSAIIRITPIGADNKRGCQARINADKFFETMRAGFSAPRKYLLNNLIKRGIIKREEGGKIWQKLGWNLKIRAQELSVEDWIKLVNRLIG